MTIYDALVYSFSNSVEVERLRVQCRSFKGMFKFSLKFLLALKLLVFSLSLIDSLFLCASSFLYPHKNIIVLPT